ncbi:MAG: ribosome maturation factor RimM [Ignavibacteria bacterium]|nr:ribosome maturation factor RimM [Ignavibacteria bacterium]
MSRSSRTLYAVGKIVKAFGINGEVVVNLMTDSPARFKTLERVLIGRNDSDVEETTVEYATIGTRGVRVKLTNVHDRSGAEGIIGSFVFVGEKDRIRVPKGKYFVHDIIGLEVVDQDENLIGTVKDVLNLPAHDVYVLDSGGREVMVPAVNEFIQKIDLEARIIRVRLIEGMVE